MKRSHWILILLVAGVSAVAIVNWMEAENLRRLNEALRRSNQKLQGDMAAMNTNDNSAATAELDRLRKDKQELLRLRSEATQLHSKAAEMVKLQNENQQLRAMVATAAAGSSNAFNRPTNPGTNGSQFPRESWAFSGYATPEAALVSTIWAMREGNPKVYWDSLSPEEQARAGKAWENKSETDIAAKHQSDTAGITGFQILNTQSISPDEVLMSVYISGVDRTEQVSVKRAGSDWKFAGFIRNLPK